MAIISYKCPNCDGELIFDPVTQNYKCEYCMSGFTQAELEEMKPDSTAEQTVVSEQTVESEQTSQDEQTTQGQQEDAVIYTCPSCGAEIVTDNTTAATFCYYCHNPVVLSGRLSGEFMPDQVIPFAFDKKQAEQKFLDFVHSKKFIPKAFFRKQQIEKLSGVYFPYWVYECTMDGTMDAQGTNIRVWRSGDMEYTETKYYSIEREGTVSLSQLSKNALQKANQQLAEGVLPYDMKEIKEFHMGYLSGFLAEKRDIEQESMRQAVSQEVKDYGKHLLRDTISGYSGVNINSCNLNITAEKWSYVLLPVWTLTYKARNGKLYYYSMNGQTGKTFGELPVDYKKVGILSGIVALVVFVLCLIGGYLL